MTSYVVFGAGLAVTALVLFSANIIVTKLASASTDLNVGFLVAVSVNVLFSGLISIAELIWRQQSVTWNTQGFIAFIFAGAFSTYLGRFFFFEAIVRFGPAKASIFQVSSPAFAALIAWGLLEEAFSVAGAIGITMAICGLIIVARPKSSQRDKKENVTQATNQAVQHKAGRLQSLMKIRGSGTALGVGGALAYGVGSVLRAHAVRSWNEPAIGAFIGAATGLALHSIFTPKALELLKGMRTANKKGILLFCVSGILTILAQICTIASMRYIPVSVASLITLCTPILVIPTSFYFMRDRESLTFRTIVGGTLTLTGIAITLLR